jgi:hypothetical protein
MMDVVRRVRNNQIGYITGGIIDIPDVWSWILKVLHFCAMIVDLKIQKH